MTHDDVIMTSLQYVTKLITVNKPMKFYLFPRLGSADMGHQSFKIQMYVKFHMTRHQSLTPQACVLTQGHVIYQL